MVYSYSYFIRMYRYRLLSQIGIFRYDSVKSKYFTCLFQCFGDA